MKLATTTEDFSRFLSTFEERIRRVYDAGFRYIDINMYVPARDGELLLADNWRDTAARLNTLADELGIRYIQAHSPGGNPLAQDAHYEQLLTTTIRSIEVCGMLGIPNTVVHNGYMKGISKEEWFERNRDFFRLLVPAMEKTGVNVLIENSTKANMGDMYFVNNAADMREFIRYFDHPQLHACWDTGHANCEGSQYDEIMTLGDELYALHINDNRGHQDEHLIPYFGTLNMDDVMHALIDSGYRGYFTFESGSSLRPSKYWLGDRHSYAGDSRLAEPTLDMQVTLEKLMYQVGEHVLGAYGVLEK